MNPESFKPKPELSPEKTELLALEKEGKYVFHGSGAEMEAPEPREASDVNRGSEGPPAIYASDHAEYAIFMAIISRENCPQGYSSGVGAHYESDGSVSLDFRAAQISLDQLTETTSGWVYVFDKAGFTQRPTNRAEFFCREATQPLQKIKVFKRDLPETIRILEKYDGVKK